MGKITIDLDGGLGNQLFEIFFTLNIAKQQGMKAFFPDKYHLPVPNQANDRHTYYNLFPSLDLSNDTKDFIKVAQKGFGYEEIKLEKEKNYLFSGFFQSFKFLKGINPGDYIKLPEQDQKMLEEKVDELRKTNRTLVSLHIRRSDYLKLQHFHNVLPIAYYRNAVETLKTLGVSDPSFVVFSDDIEWCKQNLYFLLDKTFISEKDYVEMMIMSKCDHHIIANSSFSWWGAYLNANKNKYVIYPSKWFEADIDTKELCPPEWFEADIDTKELCPPEWYKCLVIHSQTPPKVFAVGDSHLLC